MNNILGKNLKRLLLEARISENELARRTGVAQQVINRILSGENSNPKILTLSPLANYFMVSISELIGEGSISSLKGQGDIIEVPLIEFEKLATISLPELMSNCTTHLLIEADKKSRMFATKQVDNLMEPKFSEGSLLIFDIDKESVSGDFILLKLPDAKVIFRQLIIKSANRYKKALNPKAEEYNLTKVENSKQLGVLIQSRTTYLNFQTE